MAYHGLDPNSTHLLICKNYFVKQLVLYMKIPNCCKKKLSKRKRIIFLWIITFGRQIFDIISITLGICEQRKSSFSKAGKKQACLTLKERKEVFLEKQFSSIGSDKWR